MPAWPASLEPYPNNGKWKETPPETLIRDKNEVGPETVRRRAAAGVRRLTLPYQFTAEQTDIFDAWFREEIKDGALAFDFLWPPPPRNTQAVRARIVSVPSYEHEGGGVHNVTLEMEILP